MGRWSHKQAITLCMQVERACPDRGCHVALTGGLLYSRGTRKDLDLVFYRVRQRSSIDVDGLLEDLDRLGIVVTEDHGWLKKAAFLDEASVDLMFPETPSPAGGDDYGHPPPRRPATRTRASAV